MPSASSTPRIFVSHSHHDNALGLRLVADLREQLGDYAVWYDASGGLRGGDEWWKTIVAEITASDTFLVILSPDALASDWVPREMAIAYLQHVRQGKRLLPLTYRPCKLSADWELIQSLPISDPATDPAAYACQRDNLLAALGISSTATAPQPAIPVRPAHPAQAHPALNPTDMVPASAQQPDSARAPQHESFLGRMSRTAVASSPATAVRLILPRNDSCCGARAESGCCADAGTISVGLRAGWACAGCAGRTGIAGCGAVAVLEMPSAASRLSR